MQFGYFPSYVFLFIIGIIAYRNQWLQQLSSRIARRWLWVSLIVFPALPVAAIIGGDAINGGWDITALIYALWEPFIAFGIIMGLLVWFRERFNRMSRFFQHLSNNAFTVYIIHPPIVVGISLFISGLAWPPMIKFVIVALVATVCCYVAAAVIRMIPGAKRVLG